MGARDNIVPFLATIDGKVMLPAGQQAGGPAFGWQNINDSGATPQILSDISGGELQLTNDTLGPQTDFSSTLEGVGPVWDAASNTFDLRELNANDVLSVRFDFGVIPAVVTARANLEIRVYSEPGGSSGAGFLVFTLPIALEDITTTAGEEKRYLIETSMFISAFVQPGSAELVLVSSVGCEVVMRGFFVQILRGGAS